MELIPKYLVTGTWYPIPINVPDMTLNAYVPQSLCPNVTHFPFNTTKITITFICTFPLSYNQVSNHGIHLPIVLISLGLIQKVSFTYIHVLQ